MTRFVRSFNFAVEGLIYAIRTQPNLRTHLVVAALVLIASLVLRLDRLYVIALVLAIAFVVALELVNTAIESLVDLLTATHHPLAKTAKDTAAGAVLVGAIAALVVGYLAFYQGIFGVGSTVFAEVQNVPANLALMVLAVATIATLFAKARARHGSPLQGGAVSGHAALAFAVATLLALLYAKPLGALLAYFIAILVAQSRVEGRIHSALEVVWGAGLGTLVALLLYLLVRPHVVL